MPNYVLRVLKMFHTINFCSVCRLQKIFKLSELSKLWYAESPSNFHNAYYSSQSALLIISMLIGPYMSPHCVELIEKLLARVWELWWVAIAGKFLKESLEVFE